MHQTETINKETSELKLRLQRSGNQQSQQQETFSKPAWIDTMTESCSNVKTEEKKKKKENSTERYLKDLKDLSVKFDLTPNLKVKLGLWWELTKQNERKVSRTVLQKSKAVRVPSWDDQIYFSIHMLKGRINTVCSAAETLIGHFPFRIILATKDLPRSFLETCVNRLYIHLLDTVYNEKMLLHVK